MIGGEAEVVKRLEPMFAALAPGASKVSRTAGRAGPINTAELGYLHCGPSGRRSLCEDDSQRHRIWPHGGLRRGPRTFFTTPTSARPAARLMPRRLRCETRSTIKYDFDLAAISEVWRQGSVVASWLLDLTAAALAQNPTL